jgi:Carboxypeptidase regulatory-like domain
VSVKIVHLLALGIVFGAWSADATQLVVQKEVSVSRTPAGRITVPGTEEAASGVTVELRSSDWKTVIASTKSDAEGHFSLKQAEKSGLFYVRFSAPGMDIYQLRVRIDKHGAPELEVRLSVAT